MDLEIVTSERGGSALLINDFKFTKHKTSNCGKVKWLCDRRQKLGCPAKCFTQGESTNLIQHQLDHNHSPNKKKHSMQALSNSCKRKATENMYEKPEKIIKIELETGNRKDTVTERDLFYVRRNMWTARKKKLPPLPKNIFETQEALNSMEIKTDRGENFLLLNDKENKIVIFGCKENLNILSRSKTILMDGTFDYCCNYFKQLFTIFTDQNGHYIPLLFCLLPDKKEISYVVLFKKIQSLMGDSLPSEVMVDFEIGLHNAVRKVWPSAHIFGCRFHLTQSWYRQIQKLGLSRVYKNTNKDHAEYQKSKWLRNAFGLPYLSPEEVGEAFVEDLMPELPNDSKYVQFADYLVEYYLEDGAVFPPNIWASFEKTSVTNNPCESFHAHFGKKFYHPHPDLFTFINELLNTQTFVYVKINSVFDKPRVYGSRNYRKSKERLIIAKQEYLRGILSRKEYIKIASKRFIF